MKHRTIVNKILEVQQSIEDSTDYSGNDDVAYMDTYRKYVDQHILPLFTNCITQWRNDFNLLSLNKTLNKIQKSIEENCYLLLAKVDCGQPKSHVDEAINLLQKMDSEVKVHIILQQGMQDSPKGLIRANNAKISPLISAFLGISFFNTGDSNVARVVMEDDKIIDRSAHKYNLLR